MANMRHALLPALSSVVFSMCVAQTANASSDLALLDPWGSNAELTDGSHFFGQLHSKFEAGFNDQWSFSLANNGDASIDLSAVSLGKMSQLFGLTQLSLSATDSLGNNIGSVGSDGTFHLTGLSAGLPYKIAVAGTATGLFGGAYFGELAVNSDSPAAVPIGDSLPFFASALLMLGWKLKAKSKTSKDGRCNTYQLQLTA